MYETAKLAQNAPSLQPVKIGPMDEQIARLSAEQNQTFRLLDQLEEALKQVRSNAGAVGGTKEEARPCMATPLLEVVQCRHEAAAGINARLRELLESIVL